MLLSPLQRQVNLIHKYYLNDPAQPGVRARLLVHQGTELLFSINNHWKWWTILKTHRSWEKSSSQQGNYHLKTPFLNKSFRPRVDQKQECHIRRDTMMQPTTTHSQLLVKNPQIRLTKFPKTITCIKYCSLRKKMTIIVKLKKLPILHFLKLSRSVRTMLKKPKKHLHLSCLLMYKINEDLWPLRLPQTSKKTKNISKTKMTTLKTTTSLLYKRAALHHYQSKRTNNITYSDFQWKWYLQTNRLRRNQLAILETNLITSCSKAKCRLNLRRVWWFQVSWSPLRTWWMRRLNSRRHSRSIKLEFKHRTHWLRTLTSRRTLSLPLRMTLWLTLTLKSDHSLQ